MILGYDTLDDTIHVVISHSSEDFNTHYIFEINITLNDGFIRSFTQSSQPSASFTRIFGFNFNNGDLIAVTARCTQGGIITRSITVGESIPGFIGLLFIIGVSMIMMIAVFYKRLSIRVMKWP